MQIKNFHLKRKHIRKTRILFFLSLKINKRYENKSIIFTVCYAYAKRMKFRSSSGCTSKVTPNAMGDSERNPDWRVQRFSWTHRGRSVIQFCRDQHLLFLKRGNDRGFFTITHIYLTMKNSTRRIGNVQLFFPFLDFVVSNFVFHESLIYY